MAIQGAVTGAAGVIGGPGSAKEYLKGLGKSAPKRPKLTNITARTAGNETIFTLEIDTPTGEVTREISARGRITQVNVASTASSIAKLLRRPASDVEQALRESLNLPASPSAPHAGQRPMIEGGN